MAPRELKELPSILWEDENVEKWVQGYYEKGTGILVATNKRLIFLDKGLVGLRVEDFPYDKITSLQYKTGFVLGEITVFASGNKSEIKNIQKAEVGPFAEYVRARITAVSQHASAPVTPPPTAPATPPPPQEDMISKLERLG